MTRVPMAPLILGIAGLVPFLWGAATVWHDGLAEVGLNLLGGRFIGPYVQIAYGTIILAFMSGVLWGFSAHADSGAGVGYTLSVLPALFAFFFVDGGPENAASFLIIGFIGLLALDWLFWSRHLAPRWWMTLRVGLTLVVVPCLLTAIYL